MAQNKSKVTVISGGSISWNNDCYDYAGMTLSTHDGLMKFVVDYTPLVTREREESQGIAFEIEQNNIVVYDEKTGSAGLGLEAPKEDNCVNDVDGVPKKISKSRGLEEDDPNRIAEELAHELIRQAYREWEQQKQNLSLAELRADENLLKDQGESLKATNEELTKKVENAQKCKNEVTNRAISLKKELEAKLVKIVDGFPPETMKLDKAKLSAFCSAFIHRK